MDEIGNIRNKINIRDIKSYFIVKNIFSFLPQKQILNMIMHNKFFQNLFSVNIKNYIKVSGKYRIIGKNGKGKVYLIKSKQLIFEGEYLNRKKDGKGKEYHNNGELKFEGEYLNGKRNGKGKEYNYNGKLIFEGEHLNGKRNGEGKENYFNDELMFEGEYLSGKR